MTTFVHILGWLISALSIGTMGISLFTASLGGGSVSGFGIFLLSIIAFIGLKMAGAI